MSRTQELKYTLEKMALNYHDTQWLKNLTPKPITFFCKTGTLRHVICSDLANGNNEKTDKKIYRRDIEGDQGVYIRSCRVRLPLVAIGVLGHLNHIVHVAAVGGRHFSIVPSNIWQRQFWEISLLSFSFSLLPSLSHAPPSTKSTLVYLIVPSLS